MDFWRIALPIIVSGGSVALLTLLSRKAPRNRDGDRYLGIGPMIVTGILLGSVITGFMLATIAVSGVPGPNDPDGPGERWALLGLLVFMGGSTIYCSFAGWIVWRLNVTWNDDSLSYTVDGQRQTRPFSDVIGIENTSSGTTILVFDDHSVVRFSSYCRGVDELGFALLADFEQEETAVKL